jgi:hypothetical protein
LQTHDAGADDGAGTLHAHDEGEDIPRRVGDSIRTKLRTTAASVCQAVRAEQKRTVGTERRPLFLVKAVLILVILPLDGAHRTEHCLRLQHAREGIPAKNHDVPGGWIELENSFRHRLVEAHSQRLHALHVPGHVAGAIQERVDTLGNYLDRRSVRDPPGAI